MDAHCSAKFGIVIVCLPEFGLLPRQVCAQMETLIKRNPRTIIARVDNEAMPRPSPQGIAVAHGVQSAGGSHSRAFHGARNLQFAPQIGSHAGAISVLVLA